MLILKTHWHSERIPLDLLDLVAFLEYKKKVFDRKSLKTAHDLKLSTNYP